MWVPLKLNSKYSPYFTKVYNLRSACTPMRWRLAAALFYAVLAATLAASSLLPVQPPGFQQRAVLDAKLLVVALLAIVAIATPLLQGGFRELFRQALTHGRRNLWKRALLAALFQVALLAVPMLLLIGLSSRLEPMRLPNNTATNVALTFDEKELAGPSGEEGGSGGEAEVSIVENPTTPSESIQHSSALPLLAAVGAVAAITAVTALYAAYEAWSEVRAARENGGAPGAGELELLEATERAIREVEGGRDPRGAIVSYFLKLCRLLGEQGAEVGEELTAREVALLALQRFPRLDPAPLARLVGLFEEARYSDHRIEEWMRAEALVCFTAIRNSLVGGSVEG